jgi:hypothetical protein
MKAKEWIIRAKPCKHMSKKERADREIDGQTCLLCRRVALRRKGDIETTLSHEFLHTLFFDWVKEDKLSGLEYVWTIWVLDHRPDHIDIPNGDTSYADWVVR